MLQVCRDVLLRKHMGSLLTEVRAMMRDNRWDGAYNHVYIKNICFLFCPMLYLQRLTNAKDLWILHRLLKPMPDRNKQYAEAIRSWLVFAGTVFARDCSLVLSEKGRIQDVVRRDVSICTVLCV